MRRERGGRKGGRERGKLTKCTKKEKERECVWDRDRKWEREREKERERERERGREGERGYIASVYSNYTCNIIIERFLRLRKGTRFYKRKAFHYPTLILPTASKNSSQQWRPFWKVRLVRNAWTADEESGLPISHCWQNRHRQRKYKTTTILRT